MQEAVDFGGLGAFSLDPDGNLLWSNQGDPRIHSDPGDDGPIVFNGDQFHFGVETDAGTNPVISTFDLDGNQRWTTWPLQPFAGSSYPRADPFGRVIGKWGQTGIRAFDEDGNQEWVSIHPGPGGISDLRRPVVDALTGVIYTSDMFGLQLWAINPDGTTLWVKPPTGEIILDNMGLSPDGETIIISGTNNFGQPGWVRGYAATDGSFLWQVDLPPERGLNPFVSAFEPVFSADSSTVYITTQFPGDGTGYGYVYAITIGEPADVPADVTGDGVVNVDDLLAVILAWGPCPAPPQACPADIAPQRSGTTAGHGAVDVDDLLMVISNWT